MARAPTRGRGSPADRSECTTEVNSSRRRLSDAEGLELFRHFATERGDGPIVRRRGSEKSAGPPRMSLRDRVELKILEEQGFQHRFIEHYCENAARIEQLVRELRIADEILQDGDPKGRAASLAALNALAQYANVPSAAIEYLRKTLTGGKSVIKAEFEGRLAGLVEVMSWSLKQKGGATAVYGGSNPARIDPTAKKVIELAERYLPSGPASAGQSVELKVRTARRASREEGRYVVFMSEWRDSTGRGVWMALSPFGPTNWASRSSASGILAYRRARAKWVKRMDSTV